MDGINFELHTRDIFRIFVELKYLHREYASYFHSKTRSVATQAVQYLQEKFLGNGQVI